MKPNPSLLIVEDDPTQLSEYVSKLAAMGHRVTSATNAEEALSLAQRIEFDVILTDNVLPGMTGLRSIPEFAKYSQAPVLVMTSHYSAEVEKDALLLGAKCCLKKPLDFTLLDQELQRALTNGTACETPAKPQPHP